ncbi:type II secretion system F family protein [bacterium]|nr:type II secretion system F family protein [bacterium]
MPTYRPTAQDAEGLEVKAPAPEKVRITTSELLMATRQLEISLNSGITLLDALHFISVQATTPNVKALYANIAANITKGFSFSASLKACSDSFPTLYVNLIVGGEHSGTLAETMTKLADYLEKQDDFTKKIRTYMIYPCIIFLAAMGCLFFVTIFILPTFIDALGIPLDRLPLVTRVLVGISDLLTRLWYVCLAALAGGVWYVRRLLRTRGENEALDRALLKLPYLGTLLQKIAISRFVATLATMLDNGVPILQALRVAREVTGNLVIAREIDAVYENVKNGMGLSEKIKSSPYFPPLVGNMVATGEMSGRLPASLNKVNEFYEKDVDTALREFFVSLEPLLILGMGVIVGVVVAGMLLPILSMTEFA